MAVRDFKTAASQFLETISTFTSYELMDYVSFVRYAVIVSMISLPRNELYQKIIKGAEIQEVLHSPHQKLLRSYVMSLYECKYAQFFLDLAKIEIVSGYHCLNYNGKGKLHKKKIVGFEERSSLEPSLPILRARNAS